MDFPDHQIALLFGLTVTVPELVLRLMLAAFLGLLVGLERALRRKVASLRTFSFICMGSCFFSILALKIGAEGGHAPTDVTRIAAGVVQGIGFIGGGVIFKSQDKIEGITTGAMIWVTTALGMACGFGEIRLAVWGFSIYLVVLLISFALHRMMHDPVSTGQLRPETGAKSE